MFQNILELSVPALLEINLPLKGVFAKNESH